MGELILGDGLLGSEIQKQTGWALISRNSDGIDATNPETVFKAIPNGVKTIINCIADTDTYSLNGESHWKLNCVFVGKLIDFCNINKIKLIHISTDYIYSGSISSATELDVPVHCANWYGYSKLIGDGIVQLMSNDYLLIRCSHKPTPFPYKNSWIDQIGNFDYVDVIADLIIKAINLRLNGVYNVGTGIKTMHELSTRTAETSKSLAPNHVPKNITMDVTKFKMAINETE